MENTKKNLFLTDDFAAYPAVGNEVEVAGGTFVSVEATEAVVDGTLVTSPASPGYPKFIRAFLDVPGTKIG